jgi:uncharacterized phiE125 gp8 family phage protein
VAAYYSPVGTGVDVLGKESLVYLVSGTNGTGGTVDAKIQESDDNATFTDWTGGAFTQVTEATDNATFEKAYTGTKQYIRVVAKTLVASCNFGVDIVTNAATLAEDSLLETIRVAAREEIENCTRRALITSTWDYYLQEWPQRNFITLPFGNLQSVTSVSWKDTDGTEATLTAGTDYLVETNGAGCGRIVLPYACSWPTNSLYPSNPIKIRFICGWTSAASVPAKIRTAIKMIAAQMYEQRGEAIVGTIVTENKTVMRLVDSYRLWDFLYDR